MLLCCGVCGYVRYRSGLFGSGGRVREESELPRKTSAAAVVAPEGAQSTEHRSVCQRAEPVRMDGGVGGSEEGGGAPPMMTAAVEQIGVGVHARDLCPAPRPCVEEMGRLMRAEPPPSHPPSHPPSLPPSVPPSQRPPPPQKKPCEDLLGGGRIAPKSQLSSTCDTSLRPLHMPSAVPPPLAPQRSLTPLPPLAPQRSLAPLPPLAPRRPLAPLPPLAPRRPLVPLPPLAPRRPLVPLPPLAPLPSASAARQGSTVQDEPCASTAHQGGAIQNEPTRQGGSIQNEPTANQGGSIQNEPSSQGGSIQNESTRQRGSIQNGPTRQRGSIQNGPTANQGVAIQNEPTRQRGTIQNESMALYRALYVSKGQRHDDPRARDTSENLCARDMSLQAKRARRVLLPPAIRSATADAPLGGGVAQRRLSVSFAEVSSKFPKRSDAAGALPGPPAARGRAAAARCGRASSPPTHAPKRVAITPAVARLRSLRGVEQRECRTSMASAASWAETPEGLVGRRREQNRRKSRGEMEGCSSDDSDHSGVSV